MHHLFYERDTAELTVSVLLLDYSTTWQGICSDCRLNETLALGWLKEVLKRGELKSFHYIFDIIVYYPMVRAVTLLCNLRGSRCSSVT